MCLSLQYPQKNILLHLAKQRSFTGAAYPVYVKLSTRGNLTLLQAVGCILNWHTYALTVKLLGCT